MHKRYRFLALCLSVAIGLNSINIYASEVSGNSIDLTEDTVEEHSCDSEYAHHDHIVDESGVGETNDVGHDTLSDETSDVVTDVIDIGSDGSVAVNINGDEIIEGEVGVLEEEPTDTTEDTTNTISDNSNGVEGEDGKSDLTTETEPDIPADDSELEDEEDEPANEEEDEVVDDSEDKESEDTVSGNDIKVSSDDTTVSGNDIDVEDNTVSGNDVTVSGNDSTVSGNDISVSDNSLEIESYKVTFIGFEGVEIATFNTNEKTDDSDELVYPEVPAVDGYEFTGWDSDIKLISEIKEDLVITAIYVKISDLLEFNLVEGKELVKKVNGRDVKVIGTLPENAELSVTEVTDTSSIEDNIIDLISKSESGVTVDTVLSDVVSFDIKIIVEGVEFQPEQFGESVTVTISNISDSGLRLFHDDGNSVEEVDVTIEDSATFVAESFSTYTFANVKSVVVEDSIFYTYDTGSFYVSNLINYNASTRTVRSLEEWALTGFDITLNTNRTNLIKSIHDGNTILTAQIYSDDTMIDEVHYEDNPSYVTKYGEVKLFDIRFYSNSTSIYSYPELNFNPGYLMKYCSNDSEASKLKIRFGIVSDIDGSYTYTDYYYVNSLGNLKVVLNSGMDDKNMKFAVHEAYNIESLKGADDVRSIHPMITSSNDHIIMYNNYDGNLEPILNVYVGGVKVNTIKKNENKINDDRVWYDLPRNSTPVTGHMQFTFNYQKYDKIVVGTVTGEDTWTPPYGNFNYDVLSTVLDGRYFLQYYDSYKQGNDVEVTGAFLLDGVEVFETGKYNVNHFFPDLPADIGYANDFHIKWNLSDVLKVKQGYRYHSESLDLMKDSTEFIDLTLATNGFYNYYLESGESGNKITTSPIYSSYLNLSEDVPILNIYDNLTEKNLMATAKAKDYEYVFVSTSGSRKYKYNAYGPRYIFGDLEIYHPDSTLVNQELGRGSINSANLSDFFTKIENGEEFVVEYTYRFYNDTPIGFYYDGIYKETYIEPVTTHTPIRIIDDVGDISGKVSVVDGIQLNWYDGLGMEIEAMGMNDRLNHESSFVLNFPSGFKTHKLKLKSITTEDGRKVSLLPATGYINLRNDSTSISSYGVSSVDFVGDISFTADDLYERLMDLSYVYNTHKFNIELEVEGITPSDVSTGVYSVNIPTSVNCIHKEIQTLEKKWRIVSVDYPQGGRKLVRNGDYLTTEYSENTPDSNILYVKLTVEALEDCDIDLSLGAQYYYDRTGVYRDPIFDGSTLSRTDLTDSNKNYIGGRYDYRFTGAKKGYNTIYIWVNAYNADVSPAQDSAQLGGVRSMWIFAPEEVSTDYCNTTPVTTTRCKDCFELFDTTYGSKLEHVSKDFEPSNINHEIKSVVSESGYVAENEYFYDLNVNGTYNLTIEASEAGDVYIPVSVIGQEGSTDNNVYTEISATVNGTSIGYVFYYRNNKYISLPLNEGSNSVKFTASANSYSKATHFRLYKYVSAESSCITNGVDGKYCTVCGEILEKYDVTGSHKYQSAAYEGVDISFVNAKDSVNVVSNSDYKSYEFNGTSSGYYYDKVFKLEVYKELTNYKFKYQVSGLNSFNRQTYFNVKIVKEGVGVANTYEYNKRFDIYNSLGVVTIDTKLQPGTYYLTIEKQIDDTNIGNIGKFKLYFPAVNNDPFCDVIGYKEKQCIKCNHTIKTDIKGQLNHDFAVYDNGYFNNFRYHNTRNNEYELESDGYYRLKFNDTNGVGYNNTFYFFFDCKNATDKINLDFVMNSKSKYDRDVNYVVSLYKADGTSVLASSNYFKLSSSPEFIKATATINYNFTPGSYKVSFSYSAYPEDNSNSMFLDVMVPLETTPASCYEEGISSHRCNRCGIFKANKVTQLAEHQYENGDKATGLTVTLDSSVTQSYQDITYNKDYGVWTSTSKYNSNGTTSENVRFRLDVTETLDNITVKLHEKNMGSSAINNTVYFKNGSLGNISSANASFNAYTANEVKELTFNGPIAPGTYYIDLYSYVNGTSKADVGYPDIWIELPLSKTQPDCFNNSTSHDKCKVCGHVLEKENNDKTVHDKYTIGESYLTESIVNDTYWFEQEGLKFTSNNDGKDNTTAKTTFVITTDVEEVINWSVSSESRYDKFSLEVNSVKVVNEKSGTEYGTYTLTPGTHEIVMSYTKDGSGSTGSDNATVEFSKYVSLYKKPTHKDAGERTTQCRICYTEFKEEIPMLPNYNLTLNLELNGNGADTSKEVKFFIKQFDEEGNVITDTFEVVDGLGSKVTDLTYNSEGIAELTMKHNSPLTIVGFYGGEAYEITYADLDDEGYTVVCNQGILKSDVGIDEDSTINVVAVKNASVPTGIGVDPIPYILIICFIIPLYALYTKCKVKEND